MTQNEDGQPNSFDAREAIQEALQNKDWAAAAKEASEHAKETLKGAPLEDRARFDERSATEDALTRMRNTLVHLDPSLRPYGIRAVKANEDWIKAHTAKIAAEERNDHEAAERAQREEERANREIETFELMKGLHTSTLRSTEILEEIQKDRERAQTEQTAQHAFNRKMTAIAILIAAASLLATIGVPLIESLTPRDPTPVVVVEDAALQNLETAESLSPTKKPTKAPTTKPAVAPPAKVPAPSPSPIPTQR